MFIIVRLFTEHEKKRKGEERRGEAARSEQILVVAYLTPK